MLKVTKEVAVRLPPHPGPGYTVRGFGVREASGSWTLAPHLWAALERHVEQGTRRTTIFAVADPEPGSGRGPLVTEWHPGAGDDPGRWATWFFECGETRGGAT